jgi:hypothetical protein
MALPTKENGTVDFKAILEHARSIGNQEKELKKVRVVEYHVFLMMVKDGKYYYASDYLVCSGLREVKSLCRKLNVGYSPSYSSNATNLKKDSDISEFSLHEAAKSIAVEDLKMSMDIIERLVEVH